ncbi:cytochrome P450 2U1-like [Branchiostoma floridae]|uniref:Cytochrome P450 2U1 n=2 Tax=Branchiostoma floridae TaxID=7739 RepID=A0A9J7L8W1_BRAFL|nr:cytochrome P450 2U1-like [Branchiostoma floridae]
MASLSEVVTTARDYVDVPTILVAACACLLTFLYLQWPKNLPPGPWGWPLLGNIPMLAKCAFVPATFTELSKQYGDVMTVWIGRDVNIIISGYKTIRNALVKRADEFSSRRIFPAVADLRGPGDTSTSTKGVLFAAYGPDWKHQRKFALMTLRDFGVGKRSLEGKIREEADALIQEVESKNGLKFDIKQMLPNAVSNVICSIAFGNRFEYGDPEFLRLIGLMNAAVEAQPSRDILPNIHPVFRRLPFGSPHQDKLVDLTLGLQVFCSEQIEKHRETFDPNDIRDFIDAFLLEQRQAQDERARENFTDKQLQELLFDLFIAGTETTATTTRWALLYMILNPDIQEKVRQEIDSVLGQAFPSYDQRNNMPYTTATLAEVHRINTIVPLTVPHAASKDTTLNGYSIPADATLFFNLWSIHMDPQLFPEPDKFNPDRFLDQNGNFVKHEALVPFSIGHRVCLGEQLARMELFLLFVSLMQRFTFHLPEGAPVPSTVGHFGGIVNVPHPFDMCAIPRE